MSDENCPRSVKARSVRKCVLIILLCVALLLTLLSGIYIYVTRYRITDIDAASAPDGSYEILFQSVGEPDFPFGHSHARIILKSGNDTIAKCEFDVANDGGALSSDNWSVKWLQDCVQATVSGEEQAEMLYTFYFDEPINAEGITA